MRTHLLVTPDTDLQIIIWRGTCLCWPRWTASKSKYRARYVWDSFGCWSVNRIWATDYYMYQHVSDYIHWIQHAYIKCMPHALNTGYMNYIQATCIRYRLLNTLITGYVKTLHEVDSAMGDIVMLKAIHGGGGRFLPCRMQNACQARGWCLTLVSVSNLCSACFYVTECLDAQMQCESGECLSYIYYCDGQLEHCPDGSDEPASCDREYTTLKCLNCHHVWSINNNQNL